MGEPFLRHGVVALGQQREALLLQGGSLMFELAQPGRRDEVGVLADRPLRQVAGLARVRSFTNALLMLH